MKKLLTMAILGGLFAASTLQAQVNIYVAGSTAFRGNAFRVIQSSFDGGNWTSVNPSGATTSTGVYTAKGKMTSLYGSQDVYVYCSFDGSVRGLNELKNNTSTTFTNATPGGAAVSAVPTITLSDVDQSSTLAAGVPTTETHIAVLPFVYCRNYYCPTTVTNITTRQLGSLWANGLLKLSMFTGNSTDDSSSIYVTGRNKDSGTRVTAAADALYTGAHKYWGFNSGAPTTWALMNENKNGLIYGPGWDTGGNEASCLISQNATVNSVGVGCIGYLGLNDALAVAGSNTGGANAKANGGGNCSIIAYDGFLPMNNYTISTSGAVTQVPAVPDFTPIIKGQYSFWSYENLEMLSTHTAALDDTYHYYTNFVGAVDVDLQNAENNNGTSQTYGPVTAIRLSEMKVSRPSVGGSIIPN
jgi:hypothetical protein